MRHTTKQPRANRTITVDFQNEATYFQLLDDRKAFLECVLAFILSIGFQLTHKTTCRGGGCLTRPSHYVRVRLGGVTIWRLQCTTCHAVFTVLPHFVLRYRSMRPEVARDALLATHGGLSLELCAVIGHISPMALYCLICALGHQSVVTVLTRCGLPLPTYFLADEKHSHCLTDKVVWSNNMNAPILNRLQAIHRSLLALHSPLLSPILLRRTEARREWGAVWIGNNYSPILPDQWTRNSSCATSIW